MSEQETPRTVEEAAREAAGPCQHCPDGHANPTTRSWGVYVAPEWDGDSQPIRLHVMPTNGAHVAESDAAWARARLNEPTARMPSVEEVAARETVQRLIDRAVEVAADDTPLLVAVQDARAAVVALWGAL